MTSLNRITIDPTICHGKPGIRGMRWPVEVVLDLLGSGISIAKILDDHPELEKEAIVACLHYARQQQSGIVQPLPDEIHRRRSLTNSLVDVSGYLFIRFGSR